MSITGKSPVRLLAVGGIVGLIVGCLIGWLAIGWLLWPVEYVGEAYTYELNDVEKMQYVAAVADSYSLTKQVGVAQQRFNAWTTEEKINSLARLFVEDQVQGKAPEAQQVAELASELQRAEGWSPAVVNQVVSEVAAQYAQDGATDKAQAVSLFASTVGTSIVAPSESAATQVPGASEAEAPLGRNVGALLRVLGILLLVVVLVAIVLFVRRRQPDRRAAAVKPEVEWTGVGPPPLLQRTSSYSLGMDSFDESFAIETEDNEWLGECGMGISESLGDVTPRRVAAFEVWLFDKPNTRTVTKVLMSEYANHEEMLRNKLLARGDPVLAEPGATFTLETPALTVEARVMEMVYGDGTPAFGYFESLKVSLTVQRKSDAGASTDVI
jgi:hypothetical protein